MKVDFKVEKLIPFVVSLGLYALYLWLSHTRVTSLAGSMAEFGVISTLVAGNLALESTPKDPPPPGVAP